MKRLLVLLTALAALTAACSAYSTTGSTTAVGDGSVAVPTSAVEAKVEPTEDHAEFCTAAAGADVLTTDGFLDAGRYAEALAAAAAVAPGEVEDYYTDLAAYTAELATTVETGSAPPTGGFDDLFLRGVAAGVFVEDTCGFDIWDTSGSASVSGSVSFRGDD